MDAPDGRRGTGPGDGRAYGSVPSPGGSAADTAGMGEGEGDVEELQAGLLRVSRLHRRLQKLLEAVLAIGSDLDLEAVLRRIVEAAVTLVDARYGALGVIDEDRRITGFLQVGMDEETITGIGHFPEGKGVLGLLIRDPRPLRLADVGSHPESCGFPPGHPPMSTFFGVPIRTRQEVYGNLYLAEKRGGAQFDDEDEAVVRMLAAAASVAIENARLYERVRHATEEFQRRLLPDLPDLGPWRMQARYRPSSDAPRIGGDWYDAIVLPDGVPCVMVGDVMGHDVRAATEMSQISTMLRVIAFEQREPPSRILHRLDEILHRLHGGPMATVLLARLEERGPGRWRLVWSSAGHPPPLLVTRDGTARYLTGTDQGIPLGVDHGLPRPDHEETLTLGSTLLLYTDGLVEHPGQTLGWGLDDLARAAARLADCSLPELCDALVDRRGDDAHDDIALLALRLAP